MPYQAIILMKQIRRVMLSISKTLSIITIVSFDSVTTLCLYEHLNLKYLTIVRYTGNFYANSELRVAALKFVRSNIKNEFLEMKLDNKPGTRQ